MKASKRLPEYRKRRRLPLLLGVVALVLAAYVSIEIFQRKWAVGWQSVQIVKIQPPQEGEISLAVVGDVMLGRRVGDAINREGGGDYRYPFRHVRSYLREADIAVANLESPVSDRGEPIAKRIVFRVPSRAIPALVDAGFDVASVANNHVLDYGPAAAEDTGRLLSDAGIRWGALVPAEAKQEPVMLTVRGIRVGFLFYCDPSYIYSCAPEYRQFAVRPPFATEETLVRDIRELKTKADILVVSIHWGTEYQHVRPESQTISRARWIIDQGADILIGHHPHVQHGVEIYKRGVIFYSLGNFVFDQSVPVRRVSRLYRVTAGTDGVRNVAVLPLEIRFDTWEPVPITSGYVGLDADTAHRRSALAGTSPPWRVWMPKFWRRDYWLSGSRGGGDRGRRQRPGAQSRARAPGVAQLPPQMGLAGTGRERARRRVRET